MTTNERSYSRNGPVTLGSVQVGVTDTSTLKLDETLAGLEVVWLRNKPVINNLKSCAGAMNDSGLHGLWDDIVACRHGKEFR